ncbi:MAG TPA: DUF4115 domain-containing protein [Acidimicrobiales bacterium]|jgi:hypothetical protein|nr:DUF4115 domain-containing protein [Acidimicrobiales bacterium]
MTSVLIVAIVIIAIALTVRSARRALAERDAVDRHHRTLDLLGSLAERPEPVAPPGAPPTREPPGRPRRPRRPLDAARPIVPPIPPPVVAPVDPPVDAALARGYQPRHRAARPRRRPALLVAGVVLLAGIAVAAGALLRAGRNSGRPATASGTQKPTTTARPAPTTASTAVDAAVVLVTSDSQQASYTVRQPSADIELVVARPCWVQIRSGGTSGPVVFVGTLRAGARQAVPTTGGSTVLLGNPSGVSVAVNGTTLEFPRPSGTKPFTLRFQPPA